MTTVVDSQHLATSLGGGRLVGNTTGPDAALEQGDTEAELLFRLAD